MYVVISKKMRNKMTENYRNSVAFFADQDVGLSAVRHVFEKHPSHVKCVVTLSDNEIAALARSFGCQVLYYHEITVQNVETIFSGVSFIFLAWWPRIIPGFIIKIPKVGVVNFHPSFLPYNRGKNYNFWTIVEDTPFGVTLHFVDEGIDSGDILFQSSIKKSWEDSGGSLYSKAKREIVLLFQDKYLDIIEGRYVRTVQDATIARTHYSRELDEASRLDLDRKYSCRELLNLLRARTFEGKPSCYFYADEKRHEVRISIREVNDAGS